MVSVVSKRGLDELILFPNVVDQHRCFENHLHFSSHSLSLILRWRVLVLQAISRLANKNYIISIKLWLLFFNKWGRQTMGTQKDMAIKIELLVRFNCFNDQASDLYDRGRIRISGMQLAYNDHGSARVTHWWWWAVHFQEKVNLIAYNICFSYFMSQRGAEQPLRKTYCREHVFKPTMDHPLRH